MNNLITMQTLGTTGQWGNQIFQYAYVRTFAKRHGCNYAVPSWGGQYLFGHEDPHVDKFPALPRIVEHYSQIEWNQCYGIPSPPTQEEQLDHDFYGWGQYHTSWYAPDKEFIQGLYDVVSPERERVAPALANLGGMGKTLIVFHLRRSDAGREIYFLTPVTWFLKWLHEHWRDYDDPVLYISTETPELAGYFRHYHPVVMEDLGLEPAAVPPGYIYPYGDRFNDLRQLDFFPDWYVMQHADVIVASDSTFSFSAAWTSREDQKYYRARLSTQRFELVDPWDGDVSWREHLNDYPGIPGTQMDENPTYGDHWKNHSAKFPSVQLDQEEIEYWIEKSKP